MDSVTPQRGSVLADLLARFGSQQSAASAHQTLKARRGTSLGEALQESVPGTPQTPPVDQAQPSPQQHKHLHVHDTHSSPPTPASPTLSSSSATQSAIEVTEFIEESDSTSADDPNEANHTNKAHEANGIEGPPTTPEPKRPARKYRRPQLRVQLEGLVMENNKKKEPSTPRRSARVNKNDILASDTVYYIKTPKRNRSGPASPRKLDTARARLRDEIARKTQAKANGFIVANKDVFLPLLPENNYVSKLVSNEQPATVVDYQPLITQPKGVTATMKPYQLEGLSFLVHLNNNGFSGILSDEMGLGKTLQTLSLFQYLEEQDRATGSVSEESRPYLVICPLSVLNSWVNEAKKWVPDLKVLRYHGTPPERDRLKRVALGLEDQYGNETSQSKDRKASKKAGIKVSKLPTEADTDSYKIIVTTYDTFKAEQTWFKHSFIWRYVVLDEGHMIKSNVTQVSSALKRVSSEYRLILTGTPVQNDLVELWSLLAWLFPDVFTEKTQTLFKESFDLGRGRVNQKTMNDARRLLELIMLRRMKDSPGVDLRLPPKEEILLYVPLTPMQRWWYTRLLTHVEDAMLDELFTDGKRKELAVLENEKRQEEALGRFDDLATADDKEKWEESAAIMRQAINKEQSAGGATSAWRKLMNLVMQLRKCCSHPYLLPGAQPDPYYAGSHIIRASGKFIVLEKLLKHSVFEQGKKVLIFSGFKETLDWCESLLEMISGFGQEFKHLRLDGGVGRARRNLDMRLFNDRQSVYKVMLLSTRAGGLGINLTTAQDVIFLDEDWNPQVTLQAEARAHRIGQEFPVTIYKLCTQGTVEEQMMGRIRKKLYLSTKITESMRTKYGDMSDTKGSAPLSDAPEMNTAQLKSLIRRGAQTLSHPEIDVTEMVSWDLETILRKCRDKPADLQMDGEVDEEKWLAVIERVETAVLDGKRYQKDRAPKASKGPDQSNIIDTPRKRKETTVMIDGFAVSKESVGCAEWEAVPTMAGKDPRLADPVREKRPEYLHEEHCLACFEDDSAGHLVQCKSCPRAFHFDCLDEHYREKVKGFSGFFCPQHTCCDCGKSTTDAGGLLYRCRWCPRGFCEDCLDWDKAELLGDNLPEFEIMDQPSSDTGFYIKCHDCTYSMVEDEKREWIQTMTMAYAEQHKEWFQMHEEQQRNIEEQQDAAQAAPNLAPPVLEGSTPALTDNSATNDESGINTPSVQKAVNTPIRKRMTEAEPDSGRSSPKRARLGDGAQAWTLDDLNSSDEEDMWAT